MATARDFAFFPDDLRRFRRPLQHLGIREVVINDHLRALDALFRAQGDEREIAGPGADQKTFAAVLICH